MTEIKVFMTPKRFGYEYLDDIAGCAANVTDKMIQAMNDWLNAGNSKEEFTYEDLESVKRFYYSNNK